MDESRVADLARLDGVISDRSRGRFVRERANLNKAKIISQLKDRKLQSLREQLIRANKAHDEPVIKKLEMQIKNHRGESWEDYGG